MKCGDCRHYQQEGNYSWGRCTAPVPWFVNGEGFGVDFKVYASTDEDCDTFVSKVSPKTYKIRNPETGLFLLNGRWTKVGKTWSNIGHAKNAYECHARYLKEPCEIVEYAAEEIAILRPTKEFIKKPNKKFIKGPRVWTIELK